MDSFILRYGSESVYMIWLYYTSHVLQAKITTTTKIHSRFGIFYSYKWYRSLT